MRLISVSSSWSHSILGSSFLQWFHLLHLLLLDLFSISSSPMDFSFFTSPFSSSSSSRSNWMAAGPCKRDRTHAAQTPPPSSWALLGSLIPSLVSSTRINERSHLRVNGNFLAVASGFNCLDHTVLLILKKHTI